MSQEKTNDLLWIIKQSDKELDYYLSDVTKEQFRKDVKALMKRINDKEPDQAIQAYAELLLNSDEETANGELMSINTSNQLFELGQSMTREEIKEAIALYHRIKPQNQ